MNDVDPKYRVNESVLPDMGGIAARYAATLLGGWLIRRGWMTDNDLPLIQGLVLALAGIGWAAYRAYTVKARTIELAKAAPDDLAVVTPKGPPAA